MSRTYLLSVTLLLVLSVVSSEGPKPSVDENDGSFVYDDEETEEVQPRQMTSRTTNPDLKPKSDSGRKQTGTQPKKQIKKFTIQNIFKVSPPNPNSETPDSPSADPDVKSFFQAAQTAKLKDHFNSAAKTERLNPKSHDNDIDMSGLIEEVEREARSVVTQVLFRADRLYELITGGGMLGNQETSNMIMGRDDGRRLAESSGRPKNPRPRPDYNVEDSAESETLGWNNGKEDMGKARKLSSAEMEIGLSQATAAISTMKEFDDRILRMLQANDKCH